MNKLQNKDTICETNSDTVIHVHTVQIHGGS